MNKFKVSKFLISFFVLTVLMLFFFFFTSSGWFVSASANVVSWFDRAVAVPFRFFSQQKEAVAELLDTYRENRELKNTLYEAENQENQTAALQEENRQLRQALEFKDQATNEVTVASEVIARSPLSWNDELTVDKGTADGVTDSMLAVGNGGLIGSVSVAADGSSLISLLTNKENSAKISVRIQTDTAQIYGIITGYDTEKSAFIISQLNSSETIKEGDRVTTSGLGAYKAENLPVGKVLSVSEGKDQLNREVLVQPAADFSDLRAVVLVRN